MTGLPAATPFDKIPAVKALCGNVAAHFLDSPSKSARLIANASQEIAASFDVLSSLLVDILPHLHDFDFNEEIQANGYRSVVTLAELLLHRIENIYLKINGAKNSYFLDRKNFAQKIEAYSQAMESICVFLSYCKLLMSWSDKGCLFPKKTHEIYELLEANCGLVNQECFYGYLNSFQFCNSIRRFQRALCISVVSYSDMFYSDGSLVTLLKKSRKYLQNPKLRGKRAVRVFQYSSIEFLKSFWNSTENEWFHKLPSMMYVSLAVNKMMAILPEPISMTSREGVNVDIPIPSAHKGQAPLMVRLLSSVARNGMQGVTKGKPPSNKLIVHFHGGGFLAQSSRSHECYLRQWATQVDCPILSVDYSLAPESPFPRAVEEAFYAYCWALQHAKELGSTAENVIVAGDSAGANLSLGVTLKAIELGVRKPDGVFLAYALVATNLLPTPSRFLSLMDSLLPFGFLIKCLGGYILPGDSNKWTAKNEFKLNVPAKEPKTKDLPNDMNVGNYTRTSSIKKGSLKRAHSEESEKENTCENCNSNSAKGQSTECNEQCRNRCETPSSCASNEDLEDEIEKEVLYPCPLDMLSIEVPFDIYLSPYYAAPDALKQFPPVSMVAADMDPLLDDCVEMGKRFKKLGVDVKLDVLKGLCHGFLNLSLVSKEANKGSLLCAERIAELLRKSSEKAK